MSSENVNETIILRTQWQTFWDKSHPLEQAGLDVYKKAYKSLRAARKKLEKKVNKKVLDNDLIDKILGFDPNGKFDGTPQSANMAWLECGTASAGGRDLEFPKTLVPFFRLNGERDERDIRVNGETVFSLVFTMRQDNGMWRLLLSGDTITSATGRPNLRPNAGGNRSDLAIIFKRMPGAAMGFDIQFVVIGTPEHAKLMQDTQSNGVLDKTKGAGGRHFGFL